MNSPFGFDNEKAIEVILYIAHQCNDLYKLLKILYYADKDHLEKYGRFICGDQYHLLPFGPVPSKVYDILKDVRDERVLLSEEKSTEKAFEFVSKNTISPKREPDLDYFSDSDRKCLNASIEKYSTMTFDQLSEISHNQPDVKEVCENLYDERIYVRIIAKHLQDSKLLKEYINC